MGENYFGLIGIKQGHLDLKIVLLMTHQFLEIQQL